jgi:CRP-like cAMP-binding protein
LTAENDTESLAAGQIPPPASHSKVVTVHLQNIPLLSGLAPDVLKQIGLSMHFRKVEKDDYVLHKGGGGDYLLFLLAGRLKVVDLTEDGREIGLSFLSPGDYFGELSIIDGLPRSASVIATEPSLVSLLPRTQAVSLIYAHALVAERVMKRLAQKIRSASSHRAILGIPNAHQRVFALLAQLTKTAPGGLDVIENMPTQQEIAIMANTSRETVSRALQVLIQNEVVEKDLRRLIVRRPAQLKAMILDSDKNGA